MFPDGKKQSEDINTPDFWTWAFWLATSALLLNRFRRCLLQYFPYRNVIL